MYDSKGMLSFCLVIIYEIKIKQGSFNNADIPS